ncbi:EAL domain-containing protein, partial [Desulfocapsa sp. AH-315-G09]|nr:EAL domain-containing protein [Desulfocapsa sp. AH-315-G09]
MLHQCSILSDYIPKEPLELDPKWLNLIERVDYAFQPIVDIENGKTFGFEALIRGYESKTFTTIDSVFDTAYNENVLHKLDMILREKAIKKFAKLDFSKKIKLFYNLDNRITSMPDFASGETLDVMKMFDLDK